MDIVKLDFTDNTAKVNGTTYPRGSIKVVRSGSGNIRMENIYNGDTVLETTPVGNFRNGSNAEIGDQDAIVAYTDANFSKASGSGAGGGTTAAFTSSIPFTRDYTRMIHTVTGPIAFTLNTTGAVDQGGALIKLIADGTNLPTFPEQVKIVSGAYSNVAGKINNLYFVNNDGDYELYITVGATIDIVRPTVASVTVMDSATIQVVLSEAVTGTTGFTFNNGSAISITSVSGSGTDTFTFTVSGTSGAVDWDYTPGDFEDLAGNAMLPNYGTAVDGTLIQLFYKRLSDGIGTTTYTNGAGAAIAYGNDGGVTKLHITGSSGSLGVALVDFGSLFAIGDQLVVKLTGVNNISGQVILWVGSTSSLEYTQNIGAGTNSYDVDTTSLTGTHVQISTHSAVADQVYIYDIEVSKRP